MRAWPALTRSRSLRLWGAPWRVCHSRCSPFMTCMAITIQGPAQSAWDSGFWAQPNPGSSTHAQEGPWEGCIADPCGANYPAQHDCASRIVCSTLGSDEAAVWTQVCVRYLHAASTCMVLASCPFTESGLRRDACPTPGRSNLDSQSKTQAVGAGWKSNSEVSDAIYMAMTS